MSNRVRELAKVILTKPKYVKINYVRAESVAKMLQDKELVIPKWNYPNLYPQSDDFEEMCQFYLTFNAINYCYFDQDGKHFQDGSLRGSTLAATRLTEHWEDIKNPVFLASVDENYLLTELFKAESPISLVKERTDALREVGKFLNTNSDAAYLFTKLFQRYKSNAYFVSQVLPSHLPTWRDPFFKRTQLFVGMVYGRFQDWDKLPIDSESVKDLTVFADYKVPQTLIAMGIIEPSASLLSRLHRNQFLGPGSRKELELRAATILGADVLMHSLNERKDLQQNINALHIDFLLWGISKFREQDRLPKELFVSHLPNHHLTLTTDY